MHSWPSLGILEYSEEQPLAGGIPNTHPEVPWPRVQALASACQELARASRPPLSALAEVQT